MSKYYLLGDSDNDCIFYRCIQVHGDEAREFVWIEYHRGGETKPREWSRGKIEGPWYVSEDGEATGLDQVEAIEGSMFTWRLHSQQKDGAR